MFFEILAQELALRDMDSDAPTPENYDELRERMDVYLGEFEQHGTDNITLQIFNRYNYSIYKCIIYTFIYFIY